MTICIAALARHVKNEECIVFATDHMITTQEGQFEHTFSKYKKVGKNCIAMISGKALLFDDLVKITKNDTTPLRIKKRIFQNFKNKRIELIQNHLFNLYGIGTEKFLEYLSNPVPNKYVDEILTQVSQFKLETIILLIGFDGKNAFISQINETGFVDLRDINFDAIGSGASQARNALLFQGHSKEDDLRITLYDVYKAKKNAEVMNGVGEETEMWVLCRDSLKQVSDKDINIMKKIYESEPKFGRFHAKLSKLEALS